jgi:hypothetical protein
LKEFNPFSCAYFDGLDFLVVMDNRSYREKVIEIDKKGDFERFVE